MKTKDGMQKRLFLKNNVKELKKNIDGQKERDIWKNEIKDLNNFVYEGWKGKKSKQKLWTQSSQDKENTFISMKDQPGKQIMW